MSGDATVADGENPAAGLRISATSKLFVCDGWSGSANVRFAEIYSSGATVPTDYGQMVTLGENLSATPGGSFTGTLRQLAGSLLAIEPQSDGSLVLKTME